MGGARREVVAPWLTGSDDPRQRMTERRWEGVVEPKPWQRRVTATLAHLETPELVPVVVDLLRLQTEDPHVIVIDTGSSEATCRELEAMRTPEVEIHYIRSHAYRHPSGPVSAACDLAMSLTTSPYLFMTHVDCFLRRRDFLERLADDCSPTNPVIGYRMSDRSFLGTRDWKWMVSHTATMLHMPTIRSAGAVWAIEAAHDAYGQPRSPKPGGWPDTETAFNLALRRAEITPSFIGDETNYERHLDAEVDHCRSYPGSKLYSDPYHRKAAAWIEVALGEARARADAWRAGEEHDEATPPKRPTQPARRPEGTSVPSSLRKMTVTLPVAVGAEVSIESSGELAALWKDLGGSIKLANPIKVRIDGQVDFVAERTTLRVLYTDRQGHLAAVTVTNR